MSTSAPGPTAGSPDRPPVAPAGGAGPTDPSALDPARLDPARLDPARLDPAQLDPAQLEVGVADAGVGAALLEAAAGTTTAGGGGGPGATAGAEDDEPPQLTMELAPADRPVGGALRSCPVCGTPAAFEDVFCEACGLQLTNDRDHYSEQPSQWVAAVSDRGMRHPHNQDAAATDDLHAPDGTDGDPSVRRAVLVVCDGVTTAPDSELASLVGARAAREVLRDGPLADRTATVERLTRAVRAAHEEVLAQTGPDSRAATTVALAVVDQSVDQPVDQPPGEGPALAGWASVGDSRIYWLPDAGDPRLLSTDDSMAQLRVEAGVPRAEAETGPGAHAITGWIGGGDAPELRPRVELLELDGPGWLLVCSDGLWNYASDPRALQALVDDLAGRVRPGALALADALVGWANEQGGRDNVTAALARVGATTPASAQPG
ncbi:serine/threonine protein phosphatase PrpC [Friedmanniella endophytica]|uniref:Serine/threonine protein phosphatase PrpC n=1 Tax=Microlunatus kandeliicorticis TaxID=1759536 RepID=A0A7W3IUR8_9ACTN|nr:PP2C family serine/threonine-protein phosphatase [Microlunatus kandeliicorticis]MBA8795651.1 serine/threonine protein phosphatase PrpC [Microlunatus kandeliicorticis]